MHAKCKLHEALKCHECCVDSWPTNIATQIYESFTNLRDFGHKSTTIGLECMHGSHAMHPYEKPGGSWKGTW